MINSGRGGGAELPGPPGALGCHPIADRAVGDVSWSSPPTTVRPVRGRRVEQPVRAGPRRPGRSPSFVEWASTESSSGQWSPGRQWPLAVLGLRRRQHGPAGAEANHFADDVGLVAFGDDLDGRTQTARALRPRQSVCANRSGNSTHGPHVSGSPIAHPGGPYTESCSSTSASMSTPGTSSGGSTHTTMSRSPDCSNSISGADGATRRRSSTSG